VKPIYCQCINVNGFELSDIVLNVFCSVISTSCFALQFNDVLLVCVALTPLPGVKQQYKVKAKLDISGMRVWID